MNRFEEIINEKLKNYDAPEIPGAWESFNKSLPGPKIPIPINKWIIGVSGFIFVTAIAVFIIVNNINSDQSIQIASNQIEKNPSNQSKTQIVTENNNNNINLNNHSISENSASENNEVINSQNTINSGNHQTDILTNDKSNENTNINAVTNKQSEDNNHQIVKSNQVNNGADNQNSTKNNLSNLVINYTVVESCLPAKVLFEVKRVPENYTFTWHTGNSSVQNQNVLEYVYSEPGFYSASLDVFDEYGNLVEFFPLSSLTVYPLPKAIISFENKNNLYTFSSLSENTSVNEWVVENQSFTQSSLEYSFRKEGDFIIKLVAKNESGCSDEAIEKVKVNVEHNYYVPNAFRPYSDGVNATFGPIGDNMFEYSFKMLIFDKTGVLIFETDNCENLWNGKINGKGVMAEPGVYSWEIITIDKFGYKKHNKGQVTLLKN